MQGGSFDFQRDARCRTFVFLDEALKLRRKFRMGGADSKAFEEKCTFVQLLASEPLERLIVRLVHRVPLGRCMPLLRGAILDPNSAPARQVKPVTFPADCGCGGGERRAYCGVDPAAFGNAASLRESLLQTRQMALEVSRPLTPSRS